MGKERHALMVKLGGITEDQAIEVRVVTQWVQVVVMLCTHPKIWLQIESALQRFQRQIDRAESGTSGCQTIMDVRGFRFALERTFKHLLGRHILTSIEFNNAAIVKRISIARQDAFCPQARFRDRKVRAPARRDLRHLRVLVHKTTKLITSLCETSASEFLVRPLECEQRR